MAIAYKSQGAGISTEVNGANLQPLCPATVDAGDILIAHIVVLDATSALSTPAGWSLLFGPSGLGTGTPTGRAWCYGNIAAGTEDGAAINFGSLASTVGRLGRIYSFSGYVSGTITDVIPAASFAENSSELDPVIQAITTTVAGAKAVALVSQDDDNAHAGLGVVTGGTWAEAVADYIDTTVGPQGACLQIQVGTPTADPGTISGGTVAGANDEANTLNFEIRPNAPSIDADVVEAASAADAQDAIADYHVDRAEAAAATDASVAALVTLAAIVEAASATDLADASFAFAAAVAELADALSVESALLTQAAATTESSPATEVSAADQVRLAAITEVATALDVPAALLTVLAAVAESATAAEASAAQQDRVAAVSEPASAVESANGLRITAAGITEVASAADSQDANLAGAPAVYNDGVAEAAAATDVSDAVLVVVGPPAPPSAGGLILVGGGSVFRKRRRWPWEIEQREPIPEVVDVDRILVEVGRREQLRVEDELLLVLEG